MIFSRPEVLQRLCTRYGWFENGEDVTDRYGVVIMTRGMRFDTRYFAVDGSAYHDGMIWWVWDDYLWDRFEIDEQCRTEARVYDQISRDQMEDVIGILYLLEHGACWNRNVMLPLLWNWEFEAMGCGTVQQVVEQFARLGTSRLPVDVLEEWDASTIPDDDTVQHQLPEDPSYAAYPSDLDSTNSTVDLVDDDDSSFGDPEPVWIFARESPTSVMDTDNVWSVLSVSDY